MLHTGVQNSRPVKLLPTFFLPFWTLSIDFAHAWSKWGLILPTHQFYPRRCVKYCLILITFCILHTRGQNDFAHACLHFNHVCVILPTHLTFYPRALWGPLALALISVMLAVCPHSSVSCCRGVPVLKESSVVPDPCSNFFPPISRPTCSFWRLSPSMLRKTSIFWNDKKVICSDGV